MWIPDPDPFDWQPKRRYTPTQSAVYQIYHKAGMTTKTVNQELRTGGFYSLGTFNFDTLASVILNDRTGESYLSTMVAFDAVKFVTVVAVHDMAVTNVYTVPASPYVGQSTTTYVTVKNKGSQQENYVPVKAYVDGVQVGSTQHVTLQADESSTKSFSWTPCTAKIYSVKGDVGVVSGETETSDNTKTINVVVNPVAVHDMAVANVYTVPASPYVEQSTTIHVTVKNEGSQQENYVPVKAYVDGVQVGTTQYVTLQADESSTKSFSWTPSTAKIYSVKGDVGVVSGETETSDNKKTISVSVQQQNLYWLAKAIMSEASVGRQEERIAVGWTV